jgi:putative glutamine amidotransferase
VSGPAPLVAVPAYPVAPGRVERWRTAGIAVPVPYLEALRRAGAQEAILAPHEVGGADAAAIVAHFEGLLLLGGGDVDPARYGAPPHPAVYGVDPVRDAFETALLAAALRAGIPVLAICRGAQLLNVVRGGTLHQHITDDRPGHGIPGTEAGAARHPLRLEPGSRVAAAMGGTEAVCSSHHHQAIDRLGAGLSVTAWAPDGTVEAVEPDAHAWVVGVQWHPEDTAADDPAQQRLFDAFAAEAARAAAQRRIRPGSRNG